MEIVTTIVSALAAGALASMKDIGSDAVKTAYGKLKDAIIDRTGRKGAIDSLEEDPSDDRQKDVVSAAITKVGADADPEVARLTRELNELLERLTPEQQRVVGVEIVRLKGNNLNLKEIESSGDGVKVHDTDMRGDVTIENVKAGIGASKKKTE